MTQAETGPAPSRAGPKEHHELFAGGASEYRLTTIALLGAATPALRPNAGSLEILALSQTTLLTAALFGAGIAVLVVPLLVRWLKRRPGVGLAPPSVHARVDALSRLARDRESLETLMKDVRELTRLCAQQLDSRAERIEKLLAQADERIQRLEAPAGVRREAPLVESKPAVPSRARPGARTGFSGDTGSEHSQDPLARQVYELADQGRTPVEIAGSLEEHVGKVELILALRGA